MARQEGLVAQAQLLWDASEQALSDLEEEQRTAAARRKENEGRIEALERSCEEARGELRALSAEMEDKSALVADFQERQKAVESTLAGLRERQASLDADEQLRGDSVRSRDAAAAVEQSNAELEEQLRILGERQELFSERIRALQEQIAGLTARKLELEGRRVAADKAAQTKNRELLELEKNSAMLEQKKLTADMEEKQLVDKLWDNYELSRTEAQKVRQEVDSLTRAARQVSELRRSMASLGTPNLGAIEEYKRVSERYEFLSGQRDDVEKAKREILGIIREITEQMEEIFRREIREIDAAFRQIFSELFGGGKAAVQLEDENDVLGCGIDIRIQPPGKAVSNISLLSGGEKAFVAIALYFAIMRVRPTPFCVMDEIESALDEENVARFASYLRRMSGKTQFIAITHRRGTMEEADQLYGVTMQEKGVSTVLAMDMAEALRTIG